MSPAKSNRILHEIKADPLKAHESFGPLATLVGQHDFDDIHLLSNFSDFATQSTVHACKVVSLHTVNLRNPADHSQVYAVVKPLLEKLNKTSREFSFHLSPGTPAMAAIWVLFGKSAYPATLYQTWDGKVSVAEIPFDFTVDVIPELLKQQDHVWNHLLVNNTQDVLGFGGIVGKAK